LNKTEFLEVLADLIWPNREFNPSNSDRESLLTFQKSCRARPLTTTDSRSPPAVVARRGGRPTRLFEIHQNKLALF
jgi:hypothetical protein